MAGFAFVTQVRDCSVHIELINRNNCEKTVSIVPSSAQKCVDNFPPPLLLSTPRDNGLVDLKTGYLLSLDFNIISSATLSHSPCGLHSRIEYHPGESLFALNQNELSA